MSLLVYKFGGSSLSSIPKIKKVSRFIEKSYLSGNRLIICVSAMGKDTDKLVSYASEFSSSNRLEYDVLLSSGEQVSSSLLALSLDSLGLKSRSYQGWQVAIHTDAQHSRARIKGIDLERVSESLSSSEIVVISGFQGIDSCNRISTLGRGGSDTTAVALASAFKAESCEIFSDVKGIYTGDPRIVDNARKLNKISYEEMLELASCGAKILASRAVELAIKKGVRLYVRSSFDYKDRGTCVTKEEDILEKHLVTGLAHDVDEAKISLVRVRDEPGIAGKVFTPLADKGINVDMIVQTTSADGSTTHLTFTVPRGDLETAKTQLSSMRDEIGFSRLLFDDKVVKISLVGVGMRSHPGVAAKMFRVLAENSINIEVISTSEIKTSVLIREEDLEKGLKCLHSAFLVS